jgi:maltooligosyltrehalose trehalohydrolase
LGSAYRESNVCDFLVWAPRARRVDLQVVHPHDRTVPMTAGERGYYEASVEGVEPGALYSYRLDGGPDRPDPASRFQPQGVHGPSEVVVDRFEWHDQGWRGLPLAEYVFYELHVGAFSAAGTFDDVIPWLDELAELGVTAIELLPVAQFPGGRNWGYDGVYPFAPQNSYGGPEGLKRLVDACHQRGLAAVLDVVYNHLGPEGNYFREFGPYFADCYRTPWGSAMNFDGLGSDEVRRFFLENALYWIEEFHFDALRLDAVHAVYDQSALPFLGQLAAAVEQAAGRLGRQVYAIAESDLNDARLVLPRERGGLQFAAQWNDDFHHALHCLLTGESSGYYADFGGVQPLVKALAGGFAYTGQYSRARGRSHGTGSEAIEGSQLVVFIQNHDQVGNRMLGERLGHLVSFEAQKLAAGVLLLAPFVPLLFMGEEYGEDAPFPYFVSHSDPELIEAVRRGRAEAFAAFRWQAEPPDPQAEETFLQAKLNRELRRQGRHRLLWELHQELLRLRRTRPALARLGKRQIEVQGFEAPPVVSWRRWNEDDEAVAAFHFGEGEARIELPAPAGRWKKEVCSADRRWGGPGDAPARFSSGGVLELTLAGQSFALFSREGA